MTQILIYQQNFPGRLDMGDVPWQKVKDAYKICDQGQDMPAGIGSSEMVALNEWGQEGQQPVVRKHSGRMKQSTGAITPLSAF